MKGRDSRSFMAAASVGNWLGRAVWPPERRPSTPRDFCAARWQYSGAIVPIRRFRRRTGELYVDH